MSACNAEPNTLTEPTFITLRGCPKLVGRAGNNSAAPRIKANRYHIG